MTTARLDLRDRQQPDVVELAKRAGGYCVAGNLHIKHIV
jgi:hypothetical protein